MQDISRLTMAEKIDRINTLYHKSQAVGLTSEEKEEQALLRKAYVASIRASLKVQLDNIDMEKEDGTIENLGEMVRNKKTGEQHGKNSI